MSFIKDHKNLSPVLKLHILNLQINANIHKSDDNKIMLQKIEYLSKTRMFDKLLREVQNLKDLQFPSLKQKIAIAKEKNAEQKKNLNEDNIRKTLDQLYRKSLGDQDNQEIDLGQTNVYKLAKILFDQGQHQKSQDILYQLQKQGLKDFLWLRVPLARLYNEIILRRQDAKRTLESVRKRFEEIQSEQLKGASKNKKQISNLVKIHYAQKEQLLALATIIFFTKTRDEDLERYVDFCNDKSCFSVLQLLCPQLLRYVTVATIVNKNLHKNRNYFFDFYKLTEIIKRGIVKYTDPFIQFIENLYLNFDFESATQNIKDILELVSNDVLLIPLKDRIIQSCHFLYFKVYCKIHQSVEIKEIAEFINKNQLDAQLWVLKYIRSSDIEAKIDSVEGKIVSMRNKENRAQRYINAIPNINTLITTMSNSQVQVQ